MSSLLKTKNKRTNSVVMNEIFQYKVNCVVGKKYKNNKINNVVYIVYDGTHIYFKKFLYERING